jgi:hypothetical protein
MRQITILAFTLWTSVLLGQDLGKGIHKGQKLPFTICYFTYTDSKIEVEYFFQKGEQIFGHIPAKTLQINMESFSTKPAYKSKDDSITVFVKSDYYLIKRKGSDNIKVYRSSDKESEITTLRNRNRLFSFSQNLYDEYKTTPNFNQKRFWDKLHSYNLDNFVNLDNREFNKRLGQTRDDLKTNWLQHKL